MPLISCIKKDDLVIGIWEMSEALDALLELSPERKNEALAFKNKKRQREFLSVRLLADKLLGYKCEISYLDSGKPFLSNSSYNISISHTDGYAAVILHPHKEVAVDIEKVAEKVILLKDKFLSSEELATIDHDNNLLWMLVSWSAKETLFKIIPEDAIDFKKHLHLSPFTVGKFGFFTSYVTKTVNKKIYLINYIIEEKYILTYSFF